MIDTKVTREQAAEARREALQTDAAGDRGVSRARSAAPLDVGAARSLTFPAVLRARLEKRGESGKDFYHLSGIASMTDTPYEMWDLFGPYVEKVAASAFSETLAAQPDVAFLVNHKGLTMARTSAGTLELSSASQGLNSEAWLNPARNDVADLVIAIEDGCVDQMSFAAMLEEGIWNEEYTEFTMTKLNLHCGDVSAVNFGANPFTSISARAHRVLAEMDRLPVGAARAALRHLEARLDIEPRADDIKVSASSGGRSLALMRSALLADDDE